jgi:hypothetical protein
VGSWRHDRGGTFLRTTHVSTGTRRCVGTRAPLRYDTDRHATYGWLPDTRRPFGETCAAHALARAYRGGFSRMQGTDGGHLQDRHRAPPVPCARRAPTENIRTIGTGGGPAWHTLRPHHTQRSERARQMPGDARFEQLAVLPTATCATCVSTTRPIQSGREAFDKTRPTRIPIGERLSPLCSRLPRPSARDSGPRGDLEGLRAWTSSMR